MVTSVQLPWADCSKAGPALHCTGIPASWPSYYMSGHQGRNPEYVAVATYRLDTMYCCRATTAMFLAWVPIICQTSKTQAKLGKHGVAVGGMGAPLWSFTQVVTEARPKLCDPTMVVAEIPKGWPIALEVQCTVQKRPSCSVAVACKATYSATSR